MKALLALLLFIACAVQATTADPACVAIFPNNKCLFSEAVAEPIIVANLDCGVCYSASSLKSIRQIDGNELSDMIPANHKQLYSGFDFTIDCETSSVQLYRAISPTVPRCAGKMVNRSTDDCMDLVDFSIRAAPAACNYTLRTGYNQTAQPIAPVCGNWDFAVESSCGECNELPLSTEFVGHSYYRIDCITGLTTIHSDEICTDPVTTVEMSECHYYPASEYGIFNIQVYPVPWYDLILCRWSWDTFDCSGEGSLDCESVCGGCVGHNYSMLGEPALGSYTNCDDLSTTFYGSFHCRPDTVITSPIARDTCVIHDNGSFKVTYGLA